MYYILYTIYSTVLCYARAPKEPSPPGPPALRQSHGGPGTGSPKAPNSPKVASYLPGPPSLPKTMDPILPILCSLGYWAIILSSFGGPRTLPKGSNVVPFRF